MKIGWVGVHAEGLSALTAVCESEYDVVGFMTLKQDKAEKRCGSGSYEAICERFQIPIHEVGHVNDSDSIQILQSWDCDLLVVLGWGQILNSDALATAKTGVVGAHASLLPHNRGSAPVNWAIINGEDQTGNSLMWLADGVDSGDLVDQRAFPITAYDTCSTIYDHVADSNRDMVLSLLAKLEAGEIPGQPQQHTDQPILPRRRPKDGLVDWNSSSQQIYDLVRAVTRPYPGAFGDINGQPFKIWNVALLPSFTSTAFPGAVLGPVVSPEAKACGILVATKDGAVLVLEVEDADGNLLSGIQLANHNWTPQKLSIAA